MTETPVFEVLCLWAAFASVVLLGTAIIMWLTRPKDDNDDTSDR